ncbi:hypothetical protein [Nostoc sp. CCY0012]|uniref:hypothetical protein n=1 Tax=Nostoc sp. CCY0012 TaxID=1056123 RepID=UPI0039C63B42
MTDLDKNLHELPKLVSSLKLNLGNSHEIMPQVVLVNNIQDELHNIQQIIAQEIKLIKLKNNSVATIPRLGTVITLFFPNIDLGDTKINAMTRYITAKFGKPEKEISISDLQAKIDGWIEWGDFIQVISADILSDTQLVNQLNADINYFSLPTQIKNIHESLKINLAFTEPKILQQQIQQISNIHQEILQVQQRITHVITTIKNSRSLLNILIGISSFCGNSGFTLEWLDDDQELIISSDGKFHELTDILNDCELLQQEIDPLIIKINALTKQAEQSLNNVDQKTEQTPVINHQPNNIVPKIASQKKFHSTFLIASSLVILSFGSWMIKNQISYMQKTVESSNQEAIASTNFNSALNLGLEASALVQNPPLPLEVWQQAESKWQQAIDLLVSIPEGTSVYPPAADRLVRYRLNRIAINERALNEKKAGEKLRDAQKLDTEATFFVKNSPQSVLALQQAKNKLQAAIKLLESIPQSTSVYQQAQEIMPIYKSNYAAIK